MPNSTVLGNNLWLFYACVSAFFAALATIFAKMGLLEINANLGTAIRTAIILPLAWSIVWLEGSFFQLRAIDAKAWSTLVLSGLAGGMSWLFYFQALKVGKVSQVAPIDKLSVIVTIAFSILFLKEALTWKIFLGVASIMVGTLILVL
jgi:bacterial/archaeal transporter family protein